MKVGSLFSGIGGFDLGLERAGYDISWQVEIDPYCQRVLAKHWPTVPRYGDICAVDWGTVEPVDVLCGGFPCQDLSFAGKRAGIDGARSGLWSEYVRAIRHLRPRYIIVENVPGLLTNKYMGRVLGDLAQSGYDAEWTVLSAAQFGAPHLRNRVWIVAHPVSTASGGERSVLGPLADEGWSSVAAGRASLRPVDGEAYAENLESSCENVADANRGRFQQCESEAEQKARVSITSQRGRANILADPLSDHDGRTNGPWRWEWKQGEVGTGGLAKDGYWAVEPSVGRVAYGIPDRVHRLRGLGNAIVPQIAEALGRMILARVRGA